MGWFFVKETHIFKKKFTATPHPHPHNAETTGSSVGATLCGRPLTTPPHSQSHDPRDLSLPRRGGACSSRSHPHSIGAPTTGLCILNSHPHPPLRRSPFPCLGKAGKLHRRLGALWGCMCKWVCFLGAETTGLRMHWIRFHKNRLTVCIRHSLHRWQDPAKDRSELQSPPRSWCRLQG